jgi:acyl-CoA reductase-like NAD-dependent aldehyde dehydrogenase
MNYSIINPYNNEEIQSLPYASEQESLTALKELVAGQKQAQARTPNQKSQILRNIVQLLETHKDKLAETITLEMGKTISESYGEIARAQATFECAAVEVKAVSGETVDADAYGPARNKMAMVVRKPLGTVLAITPFNFPINLPAHKIAPAFAAGNTIFFKPGPQNFLSAKILTDICYEAGMEKGDIQMLVPDLPVMEKLVAHPDIPCISLTGGIKAAQAISKTAGMKKLLFELGGNDPLIVMPDADLEKASDTAINQRFLTAGQRCTASKRLFIHSEVYSQFKELLLAKAEKLTVGDPMKKETVVGPVVHAAAAELVKARIDQAQEQGAKLLLGGKREGNIIYPTILEQVPQNCELIADETFGPVIPLRQFDSIEEVIAEVNSSEFGLQAGVFTNDLTLAKKLFHELQVGALAINDGPGFRAEHLPFGGVKMSGLGREGVKYAMEEMSYLKTMIF